MIGAFSVALRDAFAPEQRRALLLSVGLALLLLVGLWIVASVLIDQVDLSGFAWLDAAFHVLGSLGALVVAWLLFPAMTALVLGFFLDGVIASIERAHYPELPPARRIGTGEAMMSGLRLVVLACVLNLLVLPLYLLPGVNLVLFYGLNGYLVGREYFEMIALRRLDWRAARLLWRWRRGSLMLAGMVIAFLLSLPFINLVAPVIGAAFLLHLFEPLRRAAPAAITER